MIQGLTGMGQAGAILERTINKSIMLSVACCYETGPYGDWSLVSPKCCFQLQVIMSLDHIRRRHKEVPSVVFSFVSRARVTVALQPSI